MPPENMAISPRSGEDQPDRQPDLRIGKEKGGEHAEAVQAVLDEHRRVLELLRLDARDREERLNAVLEETIGRADVAQAALERADSQTRWLQEELSETLSMGERVHEQAAVIRQERDEARALVERRLADILRLEAKFGSLELQAANERAAASHEIARTSRDLAAAQALVLELRRELDSRAQERADADAKLAIATAMTALKEAELAQTQATLSAERHQAAETAADRDRLDELFRQELARARAVVEVATSEAPGAWGSILRAVGLERRSQGRKALLSWLRTSSTVQANLNQGMPMGDPTRSLEREGRDPYLRANDLEDLLAWHDVSFVRCAYVTVLGRQPDLHGEKFYTDKLRQGRSKLEILGQLRRSKEAARHDPGIAGLDRAIRAAARRRWPVLGPAFHLFSRDPEAEFASEIVLPDDQSVLPARDYRPAIEARLAAIEQQVAEHSRRLEELGRAPPQVAPPPGYEAATDHALDHLRPTSPLAQVLLKIGA